MRESSTAIGSLPTRHAALVELTNGGWI